MSSIGEPEPVATIVVDVANVMGARADGWWRDRAGAALRLCGQVIALAASGIPADLMPGGLAAAPAATGPAPAAWVLVLEGRAREAATGAAELIAAAGVARVRVVRAPGSGDDAIAAEAASAASAAGPCLVVTADRELRRRCAAAGATVAGPGWLLGLL